MNFHTQRDRNVAQLDYADIALPALNAGDVGPVEIGPFSELLLRETQFEPSCADRFAKQPSWITGHSPILLIARTKTIEYSLCRM